MALFPMYVDLKGRDCLVIGAGTVALRKVEQLVKFSPRITVIAPQIHDEIQTLAAQYNIVLLERNYTVEDLRGRYLVIGALDDLSEQERIYHACIAEKTPVNCVDSPQLCSFIFPALIVEGDLCVGINTSGRAPAVSSALRKYLSALIPGGIDKLIDKVDAIRKNEPVGKERQEKIIGICRAFFDTLKQ
jgi:precorrin-2 dehydrogenase/sirohydrochlorin ferrochelatase